MTPMVPKSFWLKERMAKLIESTSHKESNDSNNGHNDPNYTNSDDDLTNSELFATEFKPNNYEKPDLTAVVAKNVYLNDDQRRQLLAVLQKNEHIFMGIRGTYVGLPVDIKLKPNAIPVWNCPYPIPLFQREAVKNKVERQCQVGALGRLSPEEIEGKDWCFPAFGIPKKNGKICFVINFQSVNNQLEQREYPLTPAEEIFHSIGDFTWVTSLDLNMGYLHIRLSQASQELLTIVMPFGFYSCTVLPMGVMPETDIFQSRMVAIFADMGPEKPISYIDDIIHLKGATFKIHLDILDKIFQRLGKAGMQVNADKSKFFSQALKFLGFTLTPTGYHLLKKQVEAIMRILPPKNVKDIRHFSGVINFIKNHINR